MAEKPIKASVWEECRICHGYGDDPHDYGEPHPEAQFCMGCGGSGGRYVKFTVTPDGAVPTAYLPGE